MTLGDIISFIWLIYTSIYKLFRTMLMAFAYLAVGIAVACIFVYPIAMLFKLLIVSVDTLLD